MHGVSTGHSSIDCYRNRPNMRTLRVAAVLGNRGLRGALDDTPIRVRLHRQLPADHVPNIIGTTVTMRG